MDRRLVVIAVGFSGLMGCGQTFGALLYELGTVPDRKIEAKFKLTQEPLLILVDDDQELLTWSPARDLLTDQVSRNLASAGSNATAFSSQQINRMRQSDAEFDKRSIRELAGKFGAKQVLWMQVEDFSATTQIEDVAHVARFTVRVKVFDPQVDDLTKMRLWPENRDGELVSVDKTASQIQSLSSNDDIARLLVEELADNVAKLFYDYKVDK